MTFTDYLEQRFIGDGGCDMDMFWDWVKKLPVENMVQHSEDWHKQEMKK
jgi:hypothetical protein